ncbi:transposase [Mesorhizobium soli]|nr:transposase [Mesorhizobium soli]
MKSAEQQAALSLHRTRNLLVKQRTQLVNMIRRLLAEFGIDIPEGLERVLSLACKIAAKEAEPDVPAVAMQILGLLSSQVLDTHLRSPRTIMRLSAHAPLLSIVHDRDYHARSFGRSIARFEARTLGRGSVRVTAIRRTTQPRLPGLEIFCP